MSTREDENPEADAAATAAALRFITRNVTDEEAAAVMAVLVTALDAHDDAASPPDTGRNAWVRSSGEIDAFDTRSSRWDRSRA